MAHNLLIRNPFLKEHTDRALEQQRIFWKAAGWSQSEGVRSCEDRGSRLDLRAVGGAFYTRARN